MIGRGGMGVVYLATDEELDRRVALKVIAPERASDHQFRRRFERESKLAASIEHPHVVTVYEAGEAAGTVYIAMRYIEGTDLGALLEAEGWLEPERAARLVAQVAGALDEAHRRGLVHRDVKPANVLVGEVGGEEWAYLSDFGATRRSTGTALTEPGEWLGTLGYASPEQIQGRRVDARSDVYSLGCVLFEALTGQLPFDRADHVAKLFAHVNDRPPAATDLAPELPAEVDRVIARALAKEPADRFPSAGDLGRAATAAVRGEPTAGRERSVATGEARSGVAADSAETAVTSRLRGPRLRRVPRWRWVAALGVLAMLIAAAALLLPRGDHPEVVAKIKVGKRPVGIAVGRALAWVTDRDEGTVSRIDPDTNQLVGPPIRVGRAPIGVRSGEGSVWVAVSGDDQVARIDPDSGEVVSRIDVENHPAGIQVGAGAVWVTNLKSDAVSRIDPDTEQVESIAVGNGPSGIAVGEGGVWVANSLDGTVSRILPWPRVVAQKITVGTRPRGVAAGAGSVWVANTSDATVSEIDPDTFQVVGEPIDVGRAPAGVTVGEKWVWITNERDNTLSRIDPDTGAVVGEAIEVGPRPRGIAVGDGSVWVANSADGTVSRIEG